MVKCSCEEWKKFFPQISAAESQAWAHGHRYSDDFKAFKFCPWCQATLIKE